ncbi:MAG: hypothetical protein MPN21_11655 [Thermoanaerobaculia bacterium]|nr:hypothetical protein [Thermoanaerobaculia bacterium]
MHTVLRDSLAILCTLLVTSVLLCSVPASALDFFVASNGDEGDANPGNGFCSTPGPIAVCTFRAAVEEANALPGQDRIFLGAGTVTIGAPEISITDDVLIEGAGAFQTVLQGDGGDSHRGLSIEENIDVSLVDLTIRGFNPEPDSHLAGGAIKSRNADITFAGVWIDSNSAYNCGGVLLEGGHVLILSSTFTHNVASGGGVEGGWGGGLCTEGADVIAYNSTFFGNSAQLGGAILVNQPGAELTLKSCTLVDNIDRSPSIEGGADDSAISQLNGSFDSRKTLIAGTCHLLGSVTSDGGNLQSPGDSCLLGVAGDQPNVPRHLLALGPIGDYGGKVPTMLPDSTSLAVEPPLSMGPACPSLDARGLPRVGRCDVGAVERQLLDFDVATIFVDGFETGNTNAWSSTSAP